MQIPKEPAFLSQQSSFSCTICLSYVLEPDTTIIATQGDHRHARNTLRTVNKYFFRVSLYLPQRNTPHRIHDINHQCYKKHRPRITDALKRRERQPTIRSSISSIKKPDKKLQIQLLNSGITITAPCQDTKYNQTRDPKPERRPHRHNIHHVLRIQTTH